MSFDLKGIFSIDGRPAKKAVKDVKDDVQKSAEQMSGYLESAFSGKLGNKIFGAAFKAAGLAAIATLVTDLADKFQDKLKNIKIGSIRTGLDRETFQKVSTITESEGSSPDTAAKGMEHIAIAQEKIKKGEPEAQKLAEAFIALGVSLADIDKKNFQEIFFKIASGMKDAEVTGEKLAAIHEILGKSGAELIPAFKKGFDSPAASAGLVTNEEIKNLEAMKASLAESDRIWASIAKWAGMVASSIGFAFRGIPQFPKASGDSILQSLGGKSLAEQEQEKADLARSETLLKSSNERRAEEKRKEELASATKQLEERQAKMAADKKQADEHKRLESENPRLQQQLQERERKNELEKLSPGQRRDALLRELTQAKGDLKLAQENEAENPGNVEAKNARLKLAFRAAGIQGELQGIKRGDSDEGVKDSLARVGGGFQNDSGKMISVMEEVRDSNRQIVDELRDLSNEDNPLSS